MWVAQFLQGSAHCPKPGHWLCAGPIKFPFRGVVPRFPIFCKLLIQVLRIKSLLLMIPLTLLIAVFLVMSIHSLHWQSTLQMSAGAMSHYISCSKCLCCLAWAQMGPELIEFSMKTVQVPKVWFLCMPPQEKQWLHQDPWCQGCHCLTPWGPWAAPKLWFQIVVPNGQCCTMKAHSSQIAIPSFQTMCLGGQDC